MDIDYHWPFSFVVEKVIIWPEDVAQEEIDAAYRQLYTEKEEASP